MRVRSRRERGFLMAAVAAAVAVLVIFGTLAFQEWLDVLRRDNEAEMMFRAKDIVRAIQRYRRDHAGVGPPKLADLMEPGPKGQYYLRKLWKDPLVKDGKWGLLYLGPGGQIVDPNEPIEPTGLEQGPGSGMGGLKPVNIFDRGEGTEGGAEGAEGTEGADQPTGPGTGQPPLPRPISSGDPGADENAGGKQLGGLPIIGVKTLCKDEPFRVYNGLTEYREWRFTYLDLERPQVPGGGPAPGFPPGGPGAPGGPAFPPGRGFGKGPGGGAFGKGSGLGKAKGAGPGSGAPER